MVLVSVLVVDVVVEVVEVVVLVVVANCDDEVNVSWEIIYKWRYNGNIMGCNGDIFKTRNGQVEYGLFLALPNELITQFYNTYAEYLDLLGIGQGWISGCFGDPWLYPY